LTRRLPMKPVAPVTKYCIVFSLSRVISGRRHS
jgi:hypothetical protein